MRALRQVVRRIGSENLSVLETSLARAAALLVGLLGISVAMRTTDLGGAFWIDEGISVGIAHHAFTTIPQVLHQDGAPPLYYLLLHAWIGVFGDSEAATHALSLTFALACVPLAYWVGLPVFGRAVGLVAATLAALDPYLTYYGQETRMYTLAAGLSFLVTGAYIRGIVLRRRRWLPVLALAIDAIVLTHNWGLFLAIGFGVATVVFARDRLRWDGALVALGAAVVYAPWLPTLLKQAAHTGAPWTTSPNLHTLVLAPGAVLAGDGPLMAFAVAGCAGLALLARAGGPSRDVVRLLAVAGAVTILVAWTGSQFTPAWTGRYLGVIAGPLLLLAAAGFVKVGRPGLVSFILVLFLWGGFSVKDEKSNAKQIARAVSAELRPGDLIVTTHPEQTPVLRYYFGPQYRYLTTLGPVADPRVMDWRDALKHLKAATPSQDLAILGDVPVGRRFVVVTPVFRDYHAWDAPWTKLVYGTSARWLAAIEADRRFRRVAVIQTDEIARKKNYWKPLQAFVFVRSSSIPGAVGGDTSR